MTNNVSRKYQVGGSIIYQPVTGPQIPGPSQGVPSQVTGQPGAGAAQAPADEGPIDKDYVKALMGKGLTNDVNAFAEHVNSAYQQYSNMSELERSSIVGQKLRSVMKGDLASMNNLVRNQEGFSKAVEIVKANGASSDYAVTERGVMVKDLKSGRVAEVSAEEYSSQLRDPSKYKLLTNGELVNEREYNPHLINDPSSINVLSNAIGMKQVKDEVKAILTGMGESSNKKSKSTYLGYGTTQDPTIEAAAQQLVGMGAKGFYKLTDMASDSSNLKQLQLAAESMWENLSENSRNLLKARAAAKGVKADKLDEYAKQSAVSLLGPSMKQSHESSRTVDYDGTMTKAVGGGGGDGANEEALTGDLGYWENLMSASGNMRDIHINGVQGGSLQAQGFMQAAFRNSSGAVGETSLRNIPELMDKINRQNVIMGDNIVNPDYLDAIVYGNSAVANVELPVTTDESGKVKINYGLIEKYNSVNKKLQEIPAGNVVAKEQVIASNGLPSNGKGGIAVKSARFLAFNATVADEALMGKKNSSWLTEVSGEAKDRYKERYKKDSKGEDIAGTDIMGWSIFGNGKVSQGQVYALISETASPIAARYSDNKDIRVPKRMNTVDHMGTERSQIRNNMTLPNNAIYNFQQ